AGADGPAEPGFTDVGLREVARLSQLKRLDLVNVSISDAGLEAIARLEKLDTLHLGACRHVTGSGLSNLAGVSQLRSIVLSGAKLTSAALTAVAHLGQLEVLSIEFDEAALVELADVEALSRLTALRRLSIGRSVAIRADGFVPQAPEDVALGNAILRVAGR